MPIAGLGIAHAPEGEPGAAQLIMRPRPIGMAHDRFGEGFHRLAIPRGLHQARAEIAARGIAIRIARENIAQDRLGLVEALQLQKRQGIFVIDFRRFRAPPAGPLQQAQRLLGAPTVAQNNRQIYCRLDMFGRAFQQVAIDFLGLGQGTGLLLLDRPREAQIVLVLQILALCDATKNEILQRAR